jgi:hypothetical protein
VVDPVDLVLVERGMHLCIQVESAGQVAPEWLFHHRWGGAKGPELIDGREITRETVGGRTTAWVPGWQK